MFVQPSPVDLNGGTCVSTLFLLSGYLFAVKHADDDPSSVCLRAQWAARLAPLLPLCIIQEFVELLQLASPSEWDLAYYIHYGCLLPLLVCAVVAAHRSAYFWAAGYGPMTLRLLAFGAILAVAYSPIGSDRWFVGAIATLTCTAPVIGVSTKRSAAAHLCRLLALYLAHLLYVGVPPLVTQGVLCSWLVGANSTYYFRPWEFWIGMEAWRLCQSCLEDAHLCSRMSRLWPIALILRFSLVTTLISLQLCLPQIYLSPPFLPQEVGSDYADRWSLLDLIGMLSVVPLDVFLVITLTSAAVCADAKTNGSQDAKTNGSEDAELVVSEERAGIEKGALEKPNHSGVPAMVCEALFTAGTSIATIGGSSSYALYLTHFDVLNEIVKLPGFLSMPHGVQLLIATVISIAFGLLVHYGLQVPLSRLWAKSWGAHVS
eukprot:CAMPEP_0174696496 /NCGR_PEP_ID=MMETSP1094-20130205/2621_1 /TAXON_ID=156173 /ORGANISM="Chrysochromulina brevifilum, Strain UTEX LB 985" /LENGTH=430 /DNA_ID=CAMNT_0015893275 /DNA_START=425 /DNA_END=1717 /DNA_ORIENTATION=-